MPQILPPALYKQHFIDKGSERIDLFRKLVKKYKINSALYPGSFVQISPSFAIPSVTYVDNDRRFPGFFADPTLQEYIESRKEYSEQPEIKFHHQSYENDIDEPLESFDLLISQYAGFISTACGKYLKIGGVLVANDSHGDASMANLDPMFQFMGVVSNRGENFTITDAGLHEYFSTRRPVEITQETLRQRGRGFGYAKVASSYVFRRIL